MSYKVTSPIRRKWTDDELAALQSRNISLTLPPCYLNIDGEVRGAEHDDGTKYVVKAIAKDTTEAVVLQKVLSTPALRRYAVPGELVECRDTYVFIMPQLNKFDSLGSYGPVYLNTLLRQLATIIDGLQLMHENNIAFVDISQNNFLISYHGFHHGQFNFAPGSICYIDFGAARILPSGPGSGVVITDWEENGGTWRPPEGTQTVDPYAYDIYSLGLIFVSAYYDLAQCSPDIREFTFVPPVCLLHFGQSLAKADPLRRPSIWQVRRRYSALQIWIRSTQWLYSCLRKTWADSVTLSGWRLLSVFVF